MAGRMWTWIGCVAVMLGALVQAPGEAGQRKPNILFFFPDQHRFDWTSMNPALPDITPNLKKLAAAGVHFTNALCPAPVCAPSRACLASGKTYANCRVSSNGVSYPLDQPTMYAMLRAAGYHVLGCGKFDLDKPGFSWGWDGQHPRSGKPPLLDAWGFTSGIDNAGKMDGVNAHKRKPPIPEPYFGFLEKRNRVDAFLKNYKLIDHDYPGPPVLPDDAYTDNWIAHNGLELIRSVPRGEPWFIQINFNGPHSPMDVTKSMYEKWKGTPLPGPRAGGGKYRAGHRRNYAAMINNIDHWLGVYQQAVAERGELENTLIVYCSDHGEMLGDHGLGGKSQPYHPSACVPLVIAGPGVRNHEVCRQPVETLDLTATFLDYAGVPRPGDMQSRSLRPFLDAGDSLPRKVARSSLKGWSLVFDGRYKLIAGSWNWGKKDKSATRQVLYDLVDDPAETVDIAAEHPEVVARLRPLLPPVNPYKQARSKRKGSK